MSDVVALSFRAMTPRSVLIAGCGYVGSALAAELVRDGHRVYGLRRQVEKLPEGVRGVAADLTDRASLDAIPSDVEQLVYAASANGRTEQAYEDAYVRGLENVLDALSAAKLERAVFTSSTAVYGQDDGAWVDEASPTEPERFTGAALLRAERTLAEAVTTSSALRLSGIYGPGRTWLVRRVASGEVTVEPDDHEGHPRYGNRIHLRDCAGALRHLLGLELLSPVYVGVDDAPAPLRDVYAYVAELLGAPPPRAGEDVGSGRGGNKRCRNARLKASGYALRVPSYREGYPEIVAGYLEAS